MSGLININLYICLVSEKAENTRELVETEHGILEHHYCKSLCLGL